MSGAEKETEKRVNSEVSSESELTDIPTKKIKLDDETKITPSKGTDISKDHTQPSKEDANSTNSTIHNEPDKSEKLDGEELTKESNENIKKEDDVDAKTDSKEEKKDVQQKDIKKPAFAFGESSSFSSGFGVAAKPFGASTPFSSGFNIAKTAKKEGQDSVKTEPGFSFGSGLSFGAGFKAAKVDTKDDTTSSKENSTSEGKESTQANTNEQVKLVKQDVQSGEETEESLFQTNAKLYQLTDIKEGWKERGVGVLHLNKDEVSEKSRIVMRSRGLLKVILNLPLLKGFSIQKGFPGSLNGEKFVRIIAVDEKNHPVQYALRTAKPEIADELYDKVKNNVPEN
ncbi:unnamed protein product [Kluyveromyces dobzhanskii CBS 2104]|uniref:WGS project CCBQ000000000 data, contig 00099 n=1 Tax=Kluyveromyces dobzhanskii CBS 2104 TaxID=1427455 RepID=A0A0A8L4F7_9SACH|nr:unnamed protein product [Kluyveromyces dobzhanskii CBS 2104]